VDDETSLWKASRVRAPGNIDVPEFTPEFIESNFSADHLTLSGTEIARRSRRIHEDILLLVQAARESKLLTYEEAIELRGEGIASNGRWLDDAYNYGLGPLDTPDLTVLVVTKGTKLPSPKALDSQGFLRLSRLKPEEIPAEQSRCFMFDYSAFPLREQLSLGTKTMMLSALMQDLELKRAVRSAVERAIQRAAREGELAAKVGKPYPMTSTREQLEILAWRLFSERKGRCALTNRQIVPGDPDFGPSLDRLNNDLGYFEGNVQLTTIFANRARGRMSCDEARANLRQY
jgi:hypothetical protein